MSRQSLRSRWLCGLLAVTCLAPLGARADERKSPGDLPQEMELPNPFVFQDGSPVRSPTDWPRRRAELQKVILAYEYGHLPPADSAVKATPEEWTPGEDAAKKQAALVEKEPAELPAGAKHESLKLTMGPNGSVFTHLILTLPPGDEKSKRPVIVRGDLCWGKVSPQTEAEVVRRGYILAQFDRTETCPDSADRTRGLYAAYPDVDGGALAAWAWGYHRVIDHLLTRPDVDAGKIVITGHSRGGKAVLLAGALDERVALTAPNNSGCGGAGSYRFQAAKSEDIAAILKNFPFWFQPKFGEFAGKVDRLPFDQHSVKALVAPRALLTTEALGDLWANPEGTMHTHLAAKEVYKFLGAPDRIAITYREGGHDHGLNDFKTLLEFADQLFFGKKSELVFDQRPFKVSKPSFKWSAPTQSAASR